MNRACTLSFALAALATITLLVFTMGRRSLDAAQPPGNPDAVPPSYVGKQVCKECHAENFQLHSAHGHSHTFRMANEPDVIEKFSGRTYTTPEGYGTYTYHVENGQLVAKIPEKFGDQSFPLQYALGSGHHGMTLLSLMPDLKQETVGIEHRASWFPKENQLGATPGQIHDQPETLSELFGQKHVGEVMHKCVHCHVTTGTIKDQQIVGLTPNVNCEKCHGPGSQHVQQARAMENPPPFSVGKADWDAEAELQLCGDCHRLPAALTSKELRDYPNVLTRFQPIGMVRSACYLESEGQLKCTTCHNPHTTVTAVGPEFYVAKCVQCHSTETPGHTVCPVSAASGCIDCHMPATPIDNYGTEFHDHWIRVHPQK